MAYNLLIETELEFDFDDNSEILLGGPNIYVSWFNFFPMPRQIVILGAEKSTAQSHWVSLLAKVPLPCDQLG